SSPSRQSTCPATISGTTATSTRPSSISWLCAPAVHSPVLPENFSKSPNQAGAPVFAYACSPSSICVDGKRAAAGTSALPQADFSEWSLTAGIVLDFLGLAMMMISLVELPAKAAGPLIIPEDEFRVR